MLQQYRQRKGNEITLFDFAAESHQMTPRSNGADEPLKRCCICKSMHPLSHFHTDKSRPDGKQSRCAQCKANRAKVAYATMTEAEKARRKLRRQIYNRLPENKLRHKMRCRLYFRKRTPEWIRRHNLRARYGMTPKQFAYLMEKQNGQCAACQRAVLPFGSRCTTREVAMVDHCHATHRIRGILCHHCNAALGNVGDEEGRLLALVDYLRRFKASLEVIGPALMCKTSAKRGARP